MNVLPAPEIWNLAKSSRSTAVQKVPEACSSRDLWASQTLSTLSKLGKMGLRFQGSLN